MPTFEENYDKFLEVVNAAKRRGRDAYSKENEEEAKDNIVKPILQSLRWPTSPTNVDPKWVVKRQYTITGWRKTDGGIVDIAIALRTPDPDKVIPVVFIEAKKVKKIRSEPFTRKERVQLLDYCLNKRVPIGILTNGFDWHIYQKPESLTEKDEAVALAVQAAIDQGEALSVFEELKNSLGRSAISEGKPEKGGAAAEFLRGASNTRNMNRAWDLLLGDKRQFLHKALASEVRKILQTLLNQTPLPSAMRKDNRIERFVVKKCKELIEQQASAIPNTGQRGLEQENPATSKGSASPAAKKPTCFYVFGTKMDFRMWSEAAQSFLTEVYRQYPNSPTQLVESLPRKFVRSAVEPHERNGKPLERWQKVYQIGNSGVWAHLSQNRTYIRSLCRDVCRVLHLPEDSIRFE